MQVLRKQAALACRFGVELQLITPREAGGLLRMNTSGDITMCVVPSCQGVLNAASRGIVPCTIAYFSPSWTPFQADRGRHSGLIVDAVSAGSWTMGVARK